MNQRLNTGRDPYAPSAEDKQRAQEMKRAWDAYNGVFRGGDEQWPLKWSKGEETNPNVIINRCGPAVDADVAWLFGESVAITIAEEKVDASGEAQAEPEPAELQEPGAPATPPAKPVEPPNPNQEAQDYLDAAWGVQSDDSSDDDKMALLQDLGTMGAIHGHAFLKIVWDTDGGMEYPKLVVLDSQQVRVMTDPHNVRIPICYVIEYTMPDPNASDGSSGTFRQVIEMLGEDGSLVPQAPVDTSATTWQIQDYWKPANGKQFAPLGPMQPWPYPWAPIEDCAHLSAPARYYGRPRITPNAIGVNEAICTVASNIMTIALAHGHPILYTIRTGANQSSIKYKPGTILEVTNDVKAVQAYGDLKDMMEQEDDLRDDFDEQTHIPAHLFGRTDAFPRVPTSGVAFRLSFGSLLSDIQKERRTYGALIRRVSQHMLELKNEAWKDLGISLNWQDPMPADDLQQAQVAQMGVQMGVMSKKTAAKVGFGLEWAEEQVYIEDEQQQAQAKQQAQMAAMGVQDTLPGEAAPGQPPAANANHPAMQQARQAAVANAGG